MTLAVYHRLPEHRTGADAIAIKHSIRRRLVAMGATSATIYRNALSPVGHYYRFIRVSFQTKDRS